MATSPADKRPLDPAEVEQALAMLRAGATCEYGDTTWSYVSQVSRYFRATWVMKDNEGFGIYVEEEAVREAIASRPAEFRAMVLGKP